MLFKYGKEHGVADPYAELCGIGWKSWHAAKILKSDWVRSIASAASSLA
jgi:hypothetical protein